MCFIPNLIFFTISYNDCQNLQWWLGLVWLWCQKMGLMAQHQIGAKVLVGARSSFRSHQFISDVLEYIPVMIFWLTKCFITQTRMETNKILCIDKWRPPDRQEA